MPSDESKGNQLDAIGSLAQRQLDNTLRSHPAADDPLKGHTVHVPNVVDPRLGSERVIEAK